ncbi:MAG: hypothetical protein K2O32_12730 [Acetatifactor sp.]|nr:hypothetical protein [Acetatifactor sp.]
MSIGGITSNSLMRYEVKKTTRNTSGKDFDHTALEGIRYKKQSANTTRQASVLDVYHSMGSVVKNVSGWEDWFKKSGHNDERVLSDEESEQAVGQESESKTEIIVKPDGSRVLVMTMSIGGMETTMSLEISKPTKAPNETSRQDTDNQAPTAENDMVSDEMSN